MYICSITLLIGLSEKEDISCNTLRIDRATFEMVYNLYWEKIYAICYNNIREAESARELVQHIFKSLWERRDELELKNISNYLIRSAKLKTFEYIRNKVSQQRHICIKFQDCSCSTNCTEEHILFNNLKEKINILVDTLPCQYRRVYKMSREQGLNGMGAATWYIGNGKAIIRTLVAGQAIDADHSYSIINIRTGSFIKKLDLLADKRERMVQAVIIEDGKAYIAVNARDRDYIWEYDPATDKLTKGAEFTGGIDYILRIEKLNNYQDLRFRHDF